MVLERTLLTPQVNDVCATALLKVYEEMEPTTWQDDGSSTAKVADLGRQHLLLYAQLSEASADDTKWRVYPKHHLFAHVVSRCLANPRLEWNYLDEAEMGVAAVLASVSNQCTVENVPDVHRQVGQSCSGSLSGTLAMKEDSPAASSSSSSESVS